MRHCMASFHLLWAFSLIVHVWQYYIKSPSLIVYILLGASCVVILRPRNILALVFAAGVQLIHLYQVLPRVPNSWLFTGMVSLTILWSYLFCVFRQKTLNPTPSSFTSEVLFPLRLETILLYFVAAFHKLNYDFFNPELSCAVAIYRSYAQLVPPFSQGMFAQYMAIISAVLVELLIAFCLTFPNWRRIGVIIAYIFHYFLSLVPFASLHSFSVLMYAMTFLFVVNDGSMDKAGAQVDILNRKWSQVVPKSVVGLQVLLVVFVILLAWLWAGMTHVNFQRQSLNIFGPVFGFLLCVFLLTKYLQQKRCPKFSTSSKNENSCWQWQQIIFPFFVLLNGLSPYLGFGTEHTFSMYSNLRTELEPNHFLMRNPPRFANFQDAVQIIATSHPDLQYFAAQNMLMPYYNFHRFLVDNPDADVSCTIHGTNAIQRTTNENHVLNPPYPALLQKFILMRPVILLGNDNVCRH